MDPEQHGTPGRHHPRDRHDGHDTPADEPEPDEDEGEPDDPEPGAMHPHDVPDGGAPTEKR